MKCNECYYCVLNKPSGSEKVCCNQESENYNKIFTKKEIETMECKDVETKQAINYRNRHLGFASHYYM